MNTLPQAVALRQAVTNLLDNVCRYTNRFEPMHVALDTGADFIELTVAAGCGDGPVDGTKFVVRLPATRPNAARGGLAGWQLKRVLDFIHDNLDKPIKVDALAEIARQSASHFHRAFKCTMGTTVHNYLMLRRIELAQQLMMGTSDSLSEIALACGMCDQSHLTRWFTRLSGESPRQWRRARMVSS